MSSKHSSNFSFSEISVQGTVKNVTLGSEPYSSAFRLTQSFISWGIYNILTQLRYRQWPNDPICFPSNLFQQKGGGQKLRDTGIANLNNYSLGWDCYGGTSGSQLHLGKNVSEFGFKEQLMVQL